ncbi:serine hydrolase domain-containing protein [Actinoplanes sp. DH11]|uniref:serine hydrolase domain-containing protein n=1 Tax=Actinoplanes sp. DH11 TaxID=2857011 RepID=UPI001E347348|nr:serine hydrolase domain-containing protein [Actinoplanes sp. DH11]
MIAHGTAGGAWAEVAEVFAALPEDPGAQLVVHHDGRLVVDLWSAASGGGDALTGIFSATKAAAYLAVARLVDDGVLELSRRIVEYWPEFGGAGKDGLTLRDLLAHRTGVIGVDGGFTAAELADDRVLAERLARQQPFWRPGAMYGYHAFVIGALLGAVVWRATGRTLQQLHADLIRAPYGVDVFLGGASEERYRPVVRDGRRTRIPPGSLTEVAFNQNADPPTDAVEWINTPHVRALGQASGGGVASARGLAGMFAAALWGAAGAPPLVSRQTLAEFAEISSPGFDRVTGERSHFGLGFEVQHLRHPGLTATAFGHSGVSGTLALADPGHGLTYAYTRQRCTYPGGAAAENAALIQAVLRAARGNGRTG